MKQWENIEAIILAAGFSSRMGRFKPLLPLAGSTVLEKSIAVFREAGVREVTVVVGYRANDLLPVLQPLGVNIVFNGDYSSGMFSSVKAGVSALQPSCQAFFLLPGDIPLVQPSTVMKLLTSHQSQPTGIIYPCYQGQRGHPPLISTHYRAAILTGSGEGGLRAILDHFEAAARDVAVRDEGVLLDLDTPGDYRKICAMLKEDIVPPVQDCLELLKQAGLSPRITQHCQAVARVAEKIACSLKEAGYQLDIDLIIAAALLHDIARGEREHAQAGAERLKQLGYLRVAEIVAHHMDLWPDQTGINETTVVYLADKLVKENQPMALEQRLQDISHKYAAQPEVLEAATRRLKQAAIIKSQIERVTAYPLEKIIVIG